MSIQKYSLMVSSPLKKASTDSNYCRHTDEPVNDISSLYEDVYFSRPITLLIYHARQLQDLLRVRKIAMEVTYRNYSPGELSLNVFSAVSGENVVLFAFLEAVVVDKIEGIDRLLVRRVGAIVIGVLRILQVGVDGKRPGERQAGDKIEDRNEGPTDPEDAKDGNKDGENREETRHCETICAACVLSG